MYKTNTKETNKKITDLNTYKNIKIINEDNDYGLYNMWNNCIKMSETYLVSSMSPDDIRGPEWAYQQIINFEPDVILVTPKYIPIEKMVSYNDLINDETLPIWFEQFCDIQNECVIYYDNTKYFNSKNMFTIYDNTIFSHNIVNCSPIWRKNKIHENNNYFNEPKYGCYADFVVWLKAGSKDYLFKQTDYKVGFYKNDKQLHKRQHDDKVCFISLVLNYANNNFINKQLKMLFELAQNDDNNSYNKFIK